MSHISAHNVDVNAGGGGADVAAQLYRTNLQSSIGDYTHCMGLITQLIVPISYLCEQIPVFQSLLVVYCVYLTLVVVYLPIFVITIDCDELHNKT